MSFMSRLNNLFPEARTDKNGNTVIRWVKRDKDGKVKNVSVPAPVAKPSPVKTVRASKLDDELITEGRTPTLDMKTRIGLFTQFGGPRDPTNMQQLFEQESDANLGIMDEALTFRANDDNSPAAKHEKRIIDQMINSFGRYEDRNGPGFVFNALAHRKAFCSEWSVDNVDPYGYRSNANAFIHGIGQSVPLYQKDLAQKVAQLRVGYELRERLRGDDVDILPTTQHYIAPDNFYPDRTVQYESYKDYAFKDFVGENAHRVGDLIDLIVDRKVTDPDVLKTLLEDPDIPIPLTDGFL